MFDLFLKNHPCSREASPDKGSEMPPPLCHLIHVCATDSDDAKRPLWNAASCLDSLNWKTLPEELRKVSISPDFLILPI